MSDFVQRKNFFFQSCAHCHGQEADGGEDAPSLLKLQMSGAHMALVIQSGIKDGYERNPNEMRLAERIGKKNGARSIQKTKETGILPND